MSEVDGNMAMSASDVTLSAAQSMESELRLRLSALMMAPPPQSDSRGPSPPQLFRRPCLTPANSCASLNTASEDSYFTATSVSESPDANTTPRKGTRVSCLTPSNSHALLDPSDIHAVRNSVCSPRSALTPLASPLTQLLGGLSRLSINDTSNSCPSAQSSPIHSALTSPRSESPHVTKQFRVPALELKTACSNFPSSPFKQRIVSAVEGIASPSNSRWVNAQNSSSWSMDDVDDGEASREGEKEVVTKKAHSLSGNDLSLPPCAPNRRRRSMPRLLPPL
jgi:hypothetical protein